MSTVVRVLSLGAGVQSSTLAAMYADGELEPKPDFAVFADVKVEPKAVYSWLERLKEYVGNAFPIYTASKGNIAEDVLGGARFASPPFFIRKGSGDIAVARRQCTREYKIEVVEKQIRRVLGYKPRERMKHTVHMVIGFSADEMRRVRTKARKPWQRNEYPLIFEKGLRRHQCNDYLEKTGLGKAPRSACWFCPYRSDAEWLAMRENDPESWMLAVEFDRKIRTLPKFKNQNFLHRDCIPLDQVDLDPMRDQMGLFGQNDCEGMCGL